MKKLILFNLAILLTLVGFSQGSFPVPVNKGGIEAAAFRQRVADSGGTYYTNSAPHYIDERKSYGLEPIFEYYPSSVKTSVTYSNLPVNGDGDFTHARSTSKTITGSTGYLTEIAANIAGIDFTYGIPNLTNEPAGENLITYPRSFGNSYWTKSGATIEGDASTAGVDLFSFSTPHAPQWANPSGSVLTYDGTGAQFNRAYFTGDVADGTMVLVTITVNSIAGGGFAVKNGATIVYETLTTTGTFSFYGVVEGTDEFYLLNLEALGTINATIDVVKAVSGYQSPSLDYPLEAYKLTATSANGYIQLTTPLTITNTTGYSNSIYVKRVTGTGNILIKDINNAETVVSGGIASANGFTRYYVTSTSSSTSGQIGVKLATSGDAVLIAFAQSEEGYLTSIMQGVEGSTTTRTQDLTGGAGDATLFASINTSGFLTVEMAALSDDGTERVLSISDGTTDNRIGLYYSSTTNQVVGDVYVGAALQAQMTYTLTDVTDFNSIGIKWNTNDFALWVNSVEVATDISGTTFPATTLDEFAFDDGAGTNPMFANTRKALIYNLPTDTEIANAQR